MADYYSLNGRTPMPLPWRIRLSDGTTRTDPSTFTAEMIADAGYVLATSMPQATSLNETVEWDAENKTWNLRQLTDEEMGQRVVYRWNEIRKERDAMMAAFEWRYTRHARETRLGLPTTDDLTAMDEYMQALADVTSDFTDPFAVEWPKFANPVA